LHIWLKILQKILSKNNSPGNNEEHTDFIDTDLDDSMWKNRSALKKNLPENNLASIIDLHRSNKYGNNNRFIQSEKNPLFEENLNKVSDHYRSLINNFGIEVFELF